MTSRQTEPDLERSDVSLAVSVERIFGRWRTRKCNNIHLINIRMEDPINEADTRLLYGY